MACHNSAISHGQGGAVQFVFRTDVRVACAYKRPCELPNDMTLKTKRRVRGYQSIQVFQIRAVQFPVAPVSVLNVPMPLRRTMSSLASR